MFWAGQYPRDVYALDFQFDSTWHGKMIKICNIIDKYTREHVAIAYALEDWAAKDATIQAFIPPGQR